MHLLLALTGVRYLYAPFDDLNGWGGNGWRVDSSLPYPPPGDGTFAVSEGDGGVSDTLISPAIALWPSPDTLWLTYSYSFAATYTGDTGKVLVRFRSGSWGGWTVLRSLSSTSRGTDTVPLPVGGDSLQVAFTYSAPGPSLYFAVDEVSVEGVVRLGVDWEAASILTPPYTFVDSAVIVGYRVRNNGEATDTATVFYGVVDGPSHSTPVVLPPGGDTVLRLPVSSSVPGYIPLFLIVSAPSDTFNSNDTLTLHLRTYPNPEYQLLARYAPPPLIDGYVLSGTTYLPPWDSAPRVPAGAWLDGSPIGSCVLLAASDGTYLYLALVTSADTYLDPLDAVLMAIDDNGDGTWASDSSEGWNLLRPPAWYVSPSPGVVPFSLREDLGSRFAFHYDPSQAYKVQVEWAVRLGGEPDPASIPDDRDTLRAAVLFEDGEDGKVVCRWPQTSDPSSPLTFGSIVLERGTGIDEVRRRPVGTGRLRVYSVSGRYLGGKTEGLPPGVYFLYDGVRVRKLVVR